MGKAQKPFIAARIPIGLEEALEKHTKSTGESKTTALINALASYIDWSEKEETKPSASDRLSLLEERVKKIEQILKTPQQTNLLELSPVISDDNKTDKEPPELPENCKTAIDNKLDNSVIKSTQGDITDNIFDNTTDNNFNNDKDTDNITENVVIKQDLEPEELAQRLFSHKEMAELTGKNYNSVKSKPRRKKDKTIAHEGITYEYIKEGKKAGWKPIT